MFLQSLRTAKRVRRKVYPVTWKTWMTQVSNRLHAHAHFPAQTAGRSCLVTAPLGEEEGGVCVHVHQNNLLRTHGPLENAWFVWKPMGRMLKWFDGSMCTQKGKCTFSHAHCYISWFLVFITVLLFLTDRTSKELTALKVYTFGMAKLHWPTYIIWRVPGV